jgi:hypothetical protein
MRIQARLVWVTLTSIVVLGAFVLDPFDDAPPSGASAPPAAAEPAVSRPAGRPWPRPTGATAPRATEPDPRGGDRPARRSGLRRAAPRRRSYDAILVAAHLSPGSIEPAALRRFWQEAADRGAPDEAIDALLAVARARVEDPALAHAALDYREDLLRLREAAHGRRADSVEDDSGDGPADAPELARAGGLAGGEPAPEEAPGRAPLPDEELDELAHVLRYSSDGSEIGRVVETLALERDARVAAILADAIDLPSAGHRLAVVDALWRTAADGRTSEEVRDALRSARSDAAPRVAARADRAIRDLERLDRASVWPPAAAGDDGGCPAEVCAGTPGPL